MFPNFANPTSPLQPGTQAHRALSALTRLTAVAGNDLHKGLVSIAISRGDTLRLQKKLTAISESARVSRLSEYQGGSDGVRNEAMRQSCSGDALWPSTIPYQHTPHTALSNRDWRLGISRRLCQIIHHNHEDLVCPACKARLPDGYGDHLLYCQRTSNRLCNSLCRNACGMMGAPTLA